jgi:uncharacterized protein (DUF924 family)
MRAIFDCVELFTALADHPASANTINYALRHKIVIERFRRFPIATKFWDGQIQPPKLNFSSNPAHHSNHYC